MVKIVSNYQKFFLKLLLKKIERAEVIVFVQDGGKKLKNFIGFQYGSILVQIFVYLEDKCMDIWTKGDPYWNSTIFQFLTFVLNENDNPILFYIF